MNYGFPRKVWDLLGFLEVSLQSMDLTFKHITLLYMEGHTTLDIASYSEKLQQAWIPAKKRLESEIAKFDKPLEFLERGGLTGSELDLKLGGIQ